MRRTEVEKIIMGNESCRQALERHVGSRPPCGCESGDDPGSASVRAVDECCPPPAPNAVTKRNFSVALPPGALDQWMPGLREKAPHEVLRLAMSLQNEEPSRRRAEFLEYAINRMSMERESDHKLIIDAIEVLNAAEQKRAVREGVKPDFIWTFAFEHRDFRGHCLFVNHSNWETYKQVRASTLKANYVHDAISSIRLTCGPNPEVEGDVFLFEHDRYQGRYQRFIAGAGTQQDTNYIGNAMNDRASSMLVVRRWNGELPATPLGSVISRDDIAADVRSRPGVASLRGNPIFTWDMWPEGGDHPNEPNRTYIYVRVPIVVDVPNWFDYDAEIRYWINLTLDGAGVLSAAVEYYGAWVEGGLITDRVLGELMNRIPGTLGDVQRHLANGLNLVNMLGPFEMVYLLPGSNADSGRVEDDVTVVLVKRAPPGPDVPIF